MGNYITTTDIAGQFPSLEITATSKPSTTQVDEYITNIEAQIDGCLRAMGITVPVTDAEAKAYLKQIAIDGASWRFLSAKFCGCSEEVERAEGFRRSFMDGLKMLKNVPRVVSTETGVTADSMIPGHGQGTADDCFDADDRKPMFTKDMET